MTGWAEDALALVSDPGAVGERGYQENGQLPAAEFNWLARELARNAHRQHASVSEVIAQVPGAEVMTLASRGPLGAVVPTSDPQPWSLRFICCDGPRVFLASKDNAIVSALDAETHEVLWSYDVGNDISALACGDGLVVVGMDASGGVGYPWLAINALTGAFEVAWGNLAADPRSVAVCDGVVAVVYNADGAGVYKNYVYLYSATTGALLGQYSHGGTVHSVALRHNLLALCGLAGTGAKHVRLLDISDPTTPVLVWSVAELDPNEDGSWVGFSHDGMNDTVVYLQLSSDIGVVRGYHLWAVGGVGQKVWGADLDPQVGASSTPCISDHGVSYIEADARKAVTLRRGDFEIVSASSGLDGVAWGGNVLHTVSLANGTGRLSASSVPVRVCLQHGQLHAVR